MSNVTRLQPRHSSSVSACLNSCAAIPFPRIDGNTAMPRRCPSAELTTLHAIVPTSRLAELTATRTLIFSKRSRNVSIVSTVSTNACGVYRLRNSSKASRRHARIPKASSSFALRMQISGIWVCKPASVLLCGKLRQRSPLPKLHFGWRGVCRSRKAQNSTLTLI